MKMKKNRWNRHKYIYSMVVGAKWRGSSNNNSLWSHSLTVFRRGFSPIYSITTDVSKHKIESGQNDFHKNCFFIWSVFCVRELHVIKSESFIICVFSFFLSLVFVVIFWQDFHTCVGQRSTHSITAAKKIIEFTAPHISSTYHHKHGYNIGQI